MTFSSTPSPPKTARGRPRVVCVIRERWPPERDGDHGVALFSSDTMKWRVFPKNTMLRRGRARTGTAMRSGLIWWPNWMHHQIEVLDTTTFQFSLIDVPTPFEDGMR